MEVMLMLRLGESVASTDCGEERNKDTTDE